jgi:hypothetical protein
MVLFVSVVLMVSAGVFAGEKGNLKKEMSMSMTLLSNSRVELNLQNLEGKTVISEVFDQAGNKIWFRNLDGRSKANVRFSISDLEEGLYTCQVKDGDEVVYSAKILKTKDGSAELRCSKNQMCTAIAPVAGIEKQVEVRVSKQRNTVATIVLTDESGEIISERKEKEGRNLILTYDLSSLPTGAYTIKVLDGKKLAGYRKINI